MAFVHGKNTAVWVNATNVSTYLNNAEFNVEVDSAETSTFQSNWKSHITGQVGATYDFEGFYDPTLATIKNLLPVTGSIVTVAPGGAAAVGDMARMISVLNAAYAESAPVGDVVAFSWSVLATGTGSIGNVLHPLAEDTNTTTGASVNDGAATSTGWSSHLHVTAVDGGSWVVKLQDSADNSAWADVTGGAFTAATGATSQRLTSATATTQLRRYVRYVATRTGGSVGDGITFLLTYSRN